MDIHASTQMTIAGPYGAKMIRALGASRLVLPRELSLEEIRSICKASDIEIEAFVHGALCYCYSGQCLLSSLIGGRSGNRGRCAQPCRLPYNGKNLMNLKDLCTLGILPQVLEAGVYSLKIEGRMKSPQYTAGVVSVYRKYVDRYLAEGGVTGRLIRKISGCCWNSSIAAALQTATTPGITAHPWCSPGRNRSAVSRMKSFGVSWKKNIFKVNYKKRLREK